MMMLDQEPSRERIRGLTEEAERLQRAARVRAVRRARRDARTRAARVRRALLAPTSAGEPYAPGR
ncbi:hypothetical protein [Actinomadura xylanilytica]|uniref:hypothetical protein n=1 Tax=Actinomadura xylanilytica TaxID=887459 RepID=UPI00255AE3CE|nr:hypothetical protein [Actinomadura xylanilytica]MDL4772035.1 hypothetical protein [Actinomadura xylanilytica]